MTKVMQAFVMVIDLQAPIDCDALHAANERIQALLVEHCPIAQQPMRQAKKKSVKK
jgi:hypothetical protein